MCTVLSVSGTAVHIFAIIAKFHYDSENSISLPLRNFRYGCENLPCVYLASACNFFNLASKLAHKLQKLMQEKLQKVKINLKTKIN